MNFDALPFIDKEYNDSKIKNQVDILISKEMMKISQEPGFSLENYLKDFSFSEEKVSTLLKQEFERMKKEENIQLNKSQDPFVQYGYEMKKFENLQNIQSTVCESYQKQNQNLTDVIKSLKTEKEKRILEIEEINRKRKFDQMNVGKQIYEMENKKRELRESNQNLTKELEKLVK